jgi:hypothetical protein
MVHSRHTVQLISASKWLIFVLFFGAIGTSATFPPPFEYIISSLRGNMADDGDDDVFVYTGGEQEVPLDVRHVIIDRSVNIIREGAFYQRVALLTFEMHDGIEIIERDAFSSCVSIRRLKMLGVREVGKFALFNCKLLTDVQFDDKLEIIRESAFIYCKSLQKIRLPSVRTIKYGAFEDCDQLRDVELPDVERIYKYAFIRCFALRRIAIPLKENMLPLDHNERYTHLPDDQYRYTQFDYCGNLTTVDLVGGIHKSISSLLLDCWRDEVNQEINRINQVLPNTDANEKTSVIREWIQTILGKMEHYRNEHRVLLKEATTLLELAMWKAKLDKNEDCSIEGRAEKAKSDTAGARKERRITSGANVVIRNVLPFLQLDE